MKNLLKILFVSGLYLLFSLVLTWPLLINFNSAIPSWGSDSLQAFSAMQERTSVLRQEGFFPGLATLAKEGRLNTFLLYSITNFFFSDFIAYNLLFIFSFVLSGLGGYWLIKYLLEKQHSDSKKWQFKEDAIAFFGGFIFAFSPFHLYQSMATNVGTMHQEWLPFFILFLSKFFENFKLKFFLGASFFLGLIAITEHQMLAFTGLFLLFFFIYQLFVNPQLLKNKKLWLYAGITGIFLLIFAFAFFKPLLEIATSENNFLSTGIEDAAGRSNDLLAGLVPPKFNPFIPNSLRFITEPLEKKSFNSVFIGYTSLALILYLILKHKDKLKIFSKNKKNHLALWIWSFLIFYLFSTGPYLHLAGFIFDKVPMPYWFIYKLLPFYENIRTVGRIFVFAMLSVSILAAFGLREVLANTKKAVFGVLVFVLLIFEFSGFPLTLNSLEHSKFYQQMATETEPYNIIEIPGSTNYEAASENLLWKNIHHKKSLSVYEFARVNEATSSLQKATPVLSDLLYSLPNGNSLSDEDIFLQDYQDLAAKVLNYYQVKYLLVSKKYVEKGTTTKNKKHQENISQEDFEKTKNYLQEKVKADLVYEDAMLLAYQVPQIDVAKGLFLAFANGRNEWSSMQQKGGRYIDDNAQFRIVDLGNEHSVARLQLNVSTKKSTDFLLLKIVHGNEEILSQELTADVTTELVSKNFFLGSQENIFTFKLFGKDGQPISNAKKRANSLLINNIKIIP